MKKFEEQLRKKVHSEIQPPDGLLERIVERTTLPEKQEARFSLQFLWTRQWQYRFAGAALVVVLAFVFMAQFAGESDPFDAENRLVVHDQEDPASPSSQGDADPAETTEPSDTGSTETIVPVPVENPRDTQQLDALIAQLDATLANFDADIAALEALDDGSLDSLSDELGELAA